MGRQRTIFAMHTATFIQPGAVYMFSITKPGIMVIPFSPREETHVCNAGPTTKLIACTIDDIDMALIRSDSRVASTM